MHVQQLNLILIWQYYSTFLTEAFFKKASFMLWAIACETIPIPSLFYFLFLGACYMLQNLSRLSLKNPNRRH